MRVKLIFLMSVTLLMMLAVSAQTVTRESPIGKTDVPKPVLKAFKSAYPQASARSYMKVEVNGVPFYRIESLEKDLHRNVTYNPDGSVAKLEERIAAATDREPGREHGHGRNDPPGSCGRGRRPGGYSRTAPSSGG